MKKNLIFLIILLSCVNIYAQDLVPGTKSIDHETLNAIRDATAPYDHDNFMRQYWCEYINIPDTTRFYEDGELRNTFKTGIYVREAFWGVIGHDTELHDAPDQTPYHILELARQHLLEPDFDDYLSIPAVIDTFVSGGNKDVLSLSSTLENLAFIVDMLWWYDAPGYETQEQFQEDLSAKLDELAGWTYQIVSNLNDPGTSYVNEEGNSVNISAFDSNKRMRFIGALGYAGCVLGKDEYIDQAEYDLFSRPLSGNKYGYIDFQTSNSGIYNEGMGYMIYAFDGLAKFFTARKRMDNADWYSDENVRSMFEKACILIMPDLCSLPFDDGRLAKMTGGAGLEYPGLAGELFTWFYQSPADAVDSRDALNWRYHNYMTEYEMDNVINYSVNLFYVYEDNSDRTFDTQGPVPAELQNGTYSDEEVTIFRRPFQSYGNYKEYPVLVVNHENSVSYSSHEHSDQSAFVLYYKGKQLLTHSGNHPSVRNPNIANHWLESAYAHNLIMVNPHHEYYEDASTDDYGLLESEELDSDYNNIRQDVAIWNGVGAINNYPFSLMQFEPAGLAGSDYSDDVAKNPAYKNYLIRNQQQQHLQVGILYDHLQDFYPSELSNDEIDIERNFYAIDIEEPNPYFIIYDNVVSSDTPTNVFMNQLYFALHPLSAMVQMEDPTSENGKFDYPFYDGSMHLFGAIGSQNSASWTVDDDIPQGLYYLYEASSDLPPPVWERNRLRIKTTTTEDEKFLTLLFPSENDDSPIRYALNNSNGYGVKYDVDTNDFYETYAAVYSGETSFVFFQDEIGFNTAADFFLIKANADWSGIKKIILNGDNSFEVHDRAGTRFEDTVIYDSEYNSEEIMAEWTNQNLFVTHKTAFNNCPKYKILRCDILPENLVSKTEFGTYYPGTEPSNKGTIENNIRNLAYDEEYFYVNYSYADLHQAGLLNNQLFIHAGVYDNLTIQGVTQFGYGNIVLKNNFSVPQNNELVFTANSHPKLNSNFHLVVDGILTAIGTEGNPIIFDKQTNENWDKIEIENTGRANMKFCKFYNAQSPLSNGGYVEIDNCLFQDNQRGIFLDNPTGYQIKNSVVSNCGYFGILLRNTHHPAFRSIIKDNLIMHNNYGLWFYNASACVEADTIFANKFAGILANRGSNPIISNSSISFTHDDFVDFPELKIGGSSYPIIDRNRNDIIFGNGLSFYNADMNPRAYRCSYNWWGTTNELAIANSFYPVNWQISFTPISLSPNVGYNPWGSENAFEAGLLAELDGDLSLAKTMYIQCIEEMPNEIEALWAIGRLLNCSLLNEDYFELQQYYADLQSDLYDLEFQKVVKVNEIYCERRQGNFQEAINKYELLLEENLSFVDSVFTELDIVYTYLEASSGEGRDANVVFRNPANELASYKEAKDKEVILWDLFESKETGGGIDSQEILKAVSHGNYPNPFNPTTNISFAIPNESKVEIEIYNIKGQLVKTIANTSFEQGKHSVMWHGDDKVGKSVASGIYFYKLIVDNKEVGINKMLLLK
ncbi:MAG: T9SS type A sorting domain-containing protein [Bacteroidetes bacterium]|nr:T9SS type A sorting domain-containing protein [Bacteroidota bacterium]